MIEPARSLEIAGTPTEPRPNPLWELTKARLREFAREKGTIFWVFGFPLLMAMALGLAFRSTPPERPRVALVLAPALAAESAAARAAHGLLESPRLQTEQLSREQALPRVMELRKKIGISRPQQGRPVSRWSHLFASGAARVPAQSR